MAERSGFPFVEAPDHFEAQGGKDATVMASGALKTDCRVPLQDRQRHSLARLRTDRRLGEIRLPDLQPGSSIMPGKVNPVMSEMVMQVAAQVVGNDATITWSAANGNFELNVMMPVLAHNLSESISILANAARVFAERCVEGIEANEASGPGIGRAQRDSGDGPQSPHRI